MNSLRIIADNTADRAVITGANEMAQLPASNLKLNRKALVWRSAATSDTLTVTWPSAEHVSGVFLPACNFTNDALMRVTTFLSGAETYDSGWFLACPPKPIGSFDWGREELGANFYAYSGGMRYAYHWIPNTVEADQAVIEVSDPENPDGYIEASRLVIGQHWSPEVTADLGVQLDVADKSTSVRSQAGDYVANPGTRYKTISFSLSTLLTEEGAKLAGILGRAGVSKPVLVSLFPENEDSSKEQAYQVYGSSPRTAASSIIQFNAVKQQVSIEEF